MNSDSTALKGWTPSLSVVIPTYGRPELLDEAIESVLVQGLADVEVIVVDDHPTIPAERSSWCAAGDPRVRIMRSGPSAGGAWAKTAGARTARGQIVVFLDDDDTLFSGACARILEAFKAVPQVDLLYLDVECFGERAVEFQAAIAASTQNLLSQHSVPSSLRDLLLLDRQLPVSLFSRIPMPFQRFAVTTKGFAEVGGFRKDCLLWDNDWSIRASFALRTAFLRGSIYRWRVGVHNLFSKAGTGLAQAQSKISYLEWMHDHPRVRESRTLARAVDRAISDGLYSLARWHLCEKRLIQGTSALVASQRRAHVARRWLTLARAFIPEG